MECLLLFVPVTAIEIEAVLGDAGQIHGTEEGAVAGPVAVVGGGFTQVVEPGPDELADGVRQVIMLDEIIFRQVGPAGMLQVVGGGLVIVIHRHRPSLHGELVDTA